eukprot:COSAG05_NODE_94_length_19565_cov_15.870133_10_plen_66_part_00
MRRECEATSGPEPEGESGDDEHNLPNDGGGEGDDTISGVHFVASIATVGQSVARDLDTAAALQFS